MTASEFRRLARCAVGLPIAVMLVVYSIASSGIDDRCSPSACIIGGIIFWLGFLGTLVASFVALLVALFKRLPLAGLSRMWIAPAVVWLLSAFWAVMPLIWSNWQIGVGELQNNFPAALVFIGALIAFLSMELSEANGQRTGPAIVVASLVAVHALLVAWPTIASNVPFWMGGDFAKASVPTIRPASWAMMFGFNPLLVTVIDAVVFAAALFALARDSGTDADTSASTVGRIATTNFRRNAAFGRRA